MRHIKLFENFLDDLFPKGQSPKSSYLPGLKRISNELLTPVAVELNKGDDDSQRLALMVSEVARLLVDDPLKLDGIVNSVDKKDLERISKITYDFPDDYVPNGYDPEGFKMFSALQESFLGNPAGVANFFSVPENSVYSLGVTLYYLFLSTLDESAFSRMESLFGF